MPGKLSNIYPLEKRVLLFIKKRHLITGREKILVAVSGGQDSVCLLHILKNLQTELGIKLHAAHLDHSLRGTESAGDAESVESMVKDMEIPVTVAKQDVRKYQREHKTSLEEAAREVRYNFLAETAAAIGADRVAVGHTVDDNVETILLHIIRGSGTRGLRGLQAKTKRQFDGKELTVIRPLLDVSRKETEEYCTKHNLQVRLDSTNLSLTPFRNRIRLELLPLLKKYNPGVTEALLRTAGIAGDDIDYLEKSAKRLWRKVVGTQDDVIIINKQAFLNLQPSNQRYLLRLALEKIAGNLKDIEARHIEEIIQAKDKPPGKKINLPYDIVFAVDYDRFLIGKDISTLSPFPALTGEYEIKIPGDTTVPGWHIHSELINPKARLESQGDFCAYFDYAKIREPLTVRIRKAGDRFNPLGLDGTKKVGSFMLDARIPHDWRDKIPILCDAAGILWVVGYRIDDKVKVTDDTNRVLKMEFERN